MSYLLLLWSSRQNFFIIVEETDATRSWTDWKRPGTLRYQRMCNGHLLKRRAWGGETENPSNYIDSRFTILMIIPKRIVKMHLVENIDNI